MSKLQRLKSLLPFTRPYLFPFERRILDELVSMLPQAQKERAQKQIEAMNTAQRGGMWEVLLFGKFRHRKHSMPTELLLDVPDGDVKVSKIELECGGTRLNAVLHSQNGALFTINFGGSYKHLRNVTDISIVKGKSLI